MQQTTRFFLWNLSKRYPWNIVGLIAIAIFWAFHISFNPYLIKLIIDEMAAAPSQFDLYSTNAPLIALLYVGVLFALNVCYRIYDWIILKTIPKMRASLTEEAFESLSKKPYSFFQTHFSGELSNKISDLGRSASQIIVQFFDLILCRCLAFFIALTTLFFIYPPLGFILAGWTLYFVTVNLIFSKKAQIHSKTSAEARSKMLGVIVDCFTNISSVFLFARRGYEKKLLTRSLDEALQKEEGLHRFLFKIKSLQRFSIVFLMGILFWFLLQARSKGIVTIGDFALVTTLTVWIVQEILFLSKQMTHFSEEMGVLRQALTLLFSDPEEKEEIKSSLLVKEGNIVFDRVTFHYKEGNPLFIKKSLSIKAGEKVGFVGFSGSGKTTFIHLLLRFFEIGEGRILIDDQDIALYSKESLRESVAVVPQDPLLFHRSIMENIRYGNPLATDEEIIEASKQAHCHEFIEKLIHKYETVVGERGVKLSGGQRQRIAIARALLKKAPILILDEATSSLDSFTERQIQESLSLLMQNRTTLVIAHRLSTLRNLDRIFVFEEGKIIEEGSHEELFSRAGAYSMLWSLQKLSEKTADCS